MSDLLEIKEKNFESEVLQSSKPVLVLFKSQWCAPCKKAFPIVEELINEYRELIKGFFIDVTENQSLVIKFEILHVPTLLFFKDGEIKEKLIANISKKEILNFLKIHGIVN
ncbi:MAG: thiol reductase thioredoxin [Armatimonadetes bacterium]|nr:thiol reductase thioredoxin [Armatimonadota bacterium]